MRPVWPQAEDMLKQVYSPHYPGNSGWWPGSTCKNVSVAVGDKLNLEPEAGEGQGVQKEKDLLAIRSEINFEINNTI